MSFILWGHSSETHLHESHRPRVLPGAPPSTACPFFPPPEDQDLRAVDVALCFGWIDGIARRLDAESYVQRFTPRRARSVWSKINRERIERLTAEGRMRPGGLAEVERAKADGRWDAAYDSPATAVVPDDLAAALAVRGLTDVYAALDGRNRFAFLNRTQTAVRRETRPRRIEQLTDALAQGNTPYPAPTKKSGT